MVVVAIFKSSLSKLPFVSLFSCRHYMHLLWQLEQKQNNDRIKIAGSCICALQAGLVVVQIFVG